MKINRPALGLACFALAAALLASSATAGPGNSLPTVRVNAEASASGLRIEAQAPVAFEYKTSSPNERMLVVEMAGVAPGDAQTAHAFATGVVAGYRLVESAPGAV